MKRLLFAALLLVTWLPAQTTKVGGAGTSKVGGAGTTKVGPVVVAANNVTIDTVGTPVTQASGWVTKTCAVDVTSHSNRAIFLLIAGGWKNGFVFDTPTSNQGGTFVQKAISPTVGTSWGYSEIWVMVAPVVATHTITVNVHDASTVTDLGLVAVSLYNVDQVTPTGTAVQLAGTSAAPSTGSITLGTGGMAIGLVGSDSEATMTITAGTVLTGYPLLNINSDTSVGAGTRTTTGTLTWTTSNLEYGLVGLPINAQ